MIIKNVQVARHRVSLAQPYEIAGARFETVDLFYLRILTVEGEHGFGAASPMPSLTGESVEDCERALAPSSLRWLRGRSIKDLPEILRALQTKWKLWPAARAGLEMGLYDLYAKSCNQPLVDVFGRRHNRLATSVTIGIGARKQILEDAQRWIDDGFRCLKVKVGRDVCEDILRIALLRERFPHITLRIDANQGYSLLQTEHLVKALECLDVQFCEQPFSASLGLNGLNSLQSSVLEKIALDESISCASETAEYVSSDTRVGVINLKTMKLGFEGARRAANDLSATGQDVMWGCVDESIVSIAAALHLAYATPTTRYIDLDGHIDVEDLASGGLDIVDGGWMLLRNEPGIGVGVDSGVFE